MALSKELPTLKMAFLEFPIFTGDVVSPNTCNVLLGEFVPIPVCENNGRLTSVKLREVKKNFMNE
jgi:hypothetical protein